MNLGKINFNGIEKIISLGIDEDEIERNDKCDDTIELDEIIDKTKEILNGENKEY